MSSEDVMTITPLGAGQEVGRSCHVLEYRDFTILLDCGIHPGFDGMNGLPFLDRIDPADLDLVIITHFHMDHAASLPYLTERTGFKGRIFMTHPTKAVLRLLLGDYLRLLQLRNAKAEDVLYTETDLHNCMNKIELMDYHETISINGGLSFYALNAGHVLGACMVWIDLPGGRSVLYTGDYSMEEDRHLMAAELPTNGAKPDVLMVESTYGVQKHASRIEREARFTGTIERIVTRGGKCLIPVFALGRAQELLLILDEFWQANPNLHHVPIYYASKMASRALRVYQTYANMMNARIRAQMDVANPFSFRFIQNMKTIDMAQTAEAPGPAVVFASPGMLQSGVSRQLFDRWASDAKNGVMVAGYAVDHTLAKEILSQPKEVVTLEGKRQPLNCLVDYVSFSAHVDFIQNRSFIHAVDPKHILLVHGSKVEMGRFKSALMFQYQQRPEHKRPTITMPPNLQEVQYKFPRRKQAKVIGRLATITTMTADSNEDEQKKKQAQRAAIEAGTAVIQEGTPVKGVLVTHNFKSKIVDPEDLATYTPLRAGSIRSKVHVPFAGASVATLEVFLTQMFAGIKKTVTPTKAPEATTSSSVVSVEKNVVVFALHKDEITVSVPVTTKTTDSGNVVSTCSNAIVEWEASPANDVIADAVMALLMHAQSSTASIRMSSQPCRHARQVHEEEQEDDQPDSKRTKLSTSESRLQLIKHALLDQFEEVEVVYDSQVKATYEIDDGACHVVVEFDSLAGDMATIAVNPASPSDDADDDTAAAIIQSNKQLAERLQTCLRNLVVAAAPLEI